jgi:site-specific DNA-methyltransferase (adenine-specific)
VDVNDNEKKHFEKEWDREQSMSAELGGVAMNKGLKAISLRDNVPSGRFPANLIHDNSEEVRECFPETKSGGGNKATKTAETFLGTGFGGTDNSVWECDSGNASRFFKSIIYQAKASKSERNMGCEKMEDKDRIDYGGFHSEKGLIENNRNPENRLPTKNNHPTVKPIVLMEYLIKMVTKK